MNIKHHKLVGEEFIPTKNMGGIIDPKFIIMHYTAGWDANSAINAFKNRKVSAQIILERDGTITQMVPFNRRAWHAGPSRFNGYKNINSHSIGIEIVNIGFFQRTNSGRWLDPYGDEHADDDLRNMGYDANKMVKTKYPRLGSGYYYFPMYTIDQLEALDELVPALIDHYGIEGIGSHEEIDTRGWKTDPGPAFPMKRYLSMFDGDRDDDYGDSDDLAYLYTVSITARLLNVREGPGQNWSVMSKVSSGDRLEVIEKDGSWLHVNIARKSGWVHERYTKRI